MKHLKISFLLLISLLLVGLCVVGSLVFGAKQIPVQEVFEALRNPEHATFSALVVRERIPRTVFAILAGAALGVSGALMQSITRNPIADPSILGVNTGASLSVVCGIAFFGISRASQYIWFALAGAAATTVLVYGIASLGNGGITPIKLALSGATASAALSSLVSAVVLPRANVTDTFRFWQVGSVSGATWEGIRSVLPFMLIGLITAFFLMPSLNAMALGDEVATGLGVKVARIRIIGTIAGVMLCGATTAIAGPIAFVGLMIPHTVRMLSGSDMKLLIPMSAVGGAVILTVSDIIGRVLGRPAEMEVGIITAFIGAPILIAIARKVKVREL